MPPLRPNEIWSLDFMHDELYVGRRFRTLNVLAKASASCWTSRSTRR
jgi:putative transposase